MFNKIVEQMPGTPVVNLRSEVKLDWELLANGERIAGTLGESFVWVNEDWCKQYGVEVDDVRCYAYLEYTGCRAQLFGFDNVNDFTNALFAKMTYQVAKRLQDDDASVKIGESEPEADVVPLTEDVVAEIDAQKQVDEVLRNSQQPPF